ncbi:hypothetical protein ACIQ1D_19175 [Lysinibacillus xylanilyticus]|uniref:hypothetical protein n=1 Tax=Lysinibacillus xylanilyticus TaxID=582475 RepID=UPI00382BD3F9
MTESIIRLGLSIFSLLISTFALIYVIRTRYRIIDRYETKIDSLLELISDQEDEIKELKEK